MHVGYLDVSPGIGTRHLESLKNPDGLNLGTYVFVCVYKIYMCIYMLEDRIFNILFLPEKQIFESKKCECETETSNLRYIDSSSTVLNYFFSSTDTSKHGKIIAILSVSGEKKASGLNAAEIVSLDMEHCIVTKVVAAKSLNLVWNLM